MGEIASRCSDVVIVTSDNPRSEDPLAILAEIEPGIRKDECQLGKRSRPGLGNFPSHSLSRTG
jgi:UDP-N-acetylmuramyl tripeptide synthase